MSDVKSGARASKFARFPPKTGSRCLPCSKFRFLPRKACEFQPAELVTACHRFVTARILGAKERKIGPSSRAPSPQGFSRPDSPLRSRLGVRQPADVSPPSLSPLMSPLMSPLHPAPVFGAKSAQNGRVRRVRFSCRTASGMPKPPSSLVFRRKPAPDVSKFQPAEHVTACHRLMRWSVSPPSLSPLMSPMSPLHPAPVFGAKRSSPKSPFFVSDCKWDARASKFAGFRSKAGSRRQFSAFGPEKRRIPARRACHRLSPLRHRSLWGRKVRECPKRFFDRDFRSIRCITPSVRFYRSLRHFAYW